MTVQITIIGLGQIGTSMGLALAKHKELVSVIGHDKNPETAQRAVKLGAVAKTHYNLPASVAEAGLVILALPVGEIRETLKYIAEDLREAAVVMDTAPVKASVAAWVKEYLPERSHYVGLLPALNPSTLTEAIGGQAAAHADLFQKGLMGIITPPGTPGDAVKLASDFTRLLGADPFYVDLAEADSLMAGIHVLPQLTSAALLNATVDQPGWLEGRKLAGRAYAASTLSVLHQDTIAGLRDASQYNKDNVLRALDIFIATLQHMREDIAAENRESLEERLTLAVDGRIRWQTEREKGDWMAVEAAKTESPSPGDFLRKMFLGKLGERAKKK